jgi:hypothetical protein
MILFFNIVRLIVDFTSSRRETTSTNPSLAARLRSGALFKKAVVASGLAPARIIRRETWKGHSDTMGVRREVCEGVEDGYRPPLNGRMDVSAVARPQGVEG